MIQQLFNLVIFISSCNTTTGICYGKKGLHKMSSILECIMKLADVVVTLIQTIKYLS